MSGYKVEICGVNTAKLPLLTNDEKEALFKRILEGDMEAREQYIKGNLRLVLSVIQRYAGNNETLRLKCILTNGSSLFLFFRNSCGNPISFFNWNISYISFLYFLKNFSD